MKPIYSATVALVCAALTSVAAALPILSISPASTSIEVGQSATFELRVQNLRPEEVLTIYEFSLRFDPTLVSVVNVTQSSRLDDGSSGHAGFFDLSTPGLIGLSDITNSLDFSALKAAQGDSFSLAVFSFSGLRVGSSLLDFMPLLTASGGIFGIEDNLNGNELIFGATNVWSQLQATPGALNYAQVVMGSAGETPVPLPSILVLSVLGLLAFSRFARAEPQSSKSAALN